MAFHYGFLLNLKSSNFAKILINLHLHSVQWECQKISELHCIALFTQTGKLLHFLVSLDVKLAFEG